ncbi:MAG TPA: hypothetical protein DF712_19740 [Balneola sp.]|nr:hypothetical protein [Bacteroidota bacterium]HCT54682.1 hypothetical protein [Balneola sp.]
MRALLVIIIFSYPLTSFAQEKAYRVYDFSIIIDYQHLSFENDFKFIYDGAYGNNKPETVDTLKLIRFEYLNQKRTVLDTLEIILSKNQVDSLFKLSANTFDLEGAKNLSKSLIPYPPPPYDGFIVDLTLDLGFRGDIYKRNFKLPFMSSFVELDKLLNRLKNGL